MSKTGLVPIIDEDRRFSVWKMDDIYTDEVGSTGRYVPNVDDLVVAYDSGWWRCTHSDIQTGYSILIPWSFTQITNVTEEMDTVVGGMSTTNDSYRVYVNTKNIPYEFSFDTRLKIYGSSASYVKLFKDGKTAGESISAVFNTAGAMITENIELEKVTIPGTNVTAIKVPKPGHLTEKLEDGEVCNAVVYSNSGAVLAIFKVVSVNTNFVRTINMGKKLITNISLISPYLSPSDSTVLLYPSNMTVDSSYLTGKVTYNDGSSERYPVDGRKFSLMGIENYITTQIGQSVPLVLSYNLASDEFANNVRQVGTSRFITKSYSLKTVESDNLYSVKLYVIPYWKGTSGEWALDYYLYNLERDRVYKVTSFIEYGVNSPSFRGDVDKWGVAQRITVSLNLDKVGPNFKYYRHVQEFTITLHQAGSNQTSSGYYTLQYDGDSVFGQITSAAMSKDPVDGTILNFAGGFNNVNQWLEAVYTCTEPLYFPFGEAAAPTPTHVKIIIGDTWSREVSLKEMLLPIKNVTDNVQQGTLIRLEFIGNYNNKRMQLSSVGMVAKRV